MPTIFEAAGGMEGMRRLAGAWHRRVMADEVVAHDFPVGVGWRTKGRDGR